MGSSVDFVVQRSHQGKTTKQVICSLSSGNGEQLLVLRKGREDKKAMYLEDGHGERAKLILASVESYICTVPPPSSSRTFPL